MHDLATEMLASTIDDNVVHGYSYNNIVEIFKNICTRINNICIFIKEWRFYE